MLNYRELIDFERSVRDRTILSVYVNGDVNDPARQRQWQLQLRHAFDDIERWLADAPHADREAFRACRATAAARLESFEATVGAPGWVAFIASGEILFEGTLPVAMPTFAAWSTGACVSPYIRAIKETRPVIVAVVDARKTRLLRYALRETEPIGTVRAHVTVEQMSHMSAPARPGFHTGTRGSTGADEAQRELREGTARMLAEAVQRIEKLAGHGEWIVVGGIHNVASAAVARLSPRLARHAMITPLDVHASDAEIADAARRCASTLRNADDLVRVSEALQDAERHARGAAGLVDTRRALEEKRVRELLFTTAFAEHNAADVNAAVRLAFDNGATVEHVSGEAADRLQLAGGIAARLWYGASASTETSQVEPATAPDAVLRTSRTPGHRSRAEARGP
jgi:hypothetical protein